MTIAGSGGELVWPAYNELWVRIAMLVRRSGRPVLLLGPLEPAEWPSDDTTVVWIHLDCSDAERRRRLAGRRWSSHAVEEALKDARTLRSLVPDRIVTDGLQPAQIAEQVAARMT